MLSKVLITYHSAEDMVAQGDVPRVADASLLTVAAHGLGSLPEVPSTVSHLTCKTAYFGVGDAGFEPATSAV